MSWGEAVRLVGILRSDPTSQVAAAVNSWERPWSHEWLATVSLFDSYRSIHFKKPKPYPRPWPDPDKQRRGRTTRPAAEVISILREYGHKIRG